MALYHFTYGYPLIGEECAIELNDELLGGPFSMPEKAPVPAMLFPTTGAQARCCVRGKHATFNFRWDTDGLPWLQLWRDFRPGSSVLSIEPCTNARQEDGTNTPMPLLMTGDSRSFAINIDISD